MTERTTQEPLSLVAQLRTTLYNLKAQHSRVQGAIEGYRSMASPGDDYRDLLTPCERTAEQLEQQITAQEQTISILSVLEHPDFWRIVREYTGEGFIFGAVTKQAHEPADIPWGESPIAALLKAHEALKPQEDALPRKEQ